MKFTQHKTFQASEKSNPKDFQAYIDTLRSGLLSKGKPFDGVCLKKDDAYVLKDLLCQCGYSQKRIDQLISQLLENSPNGEIRLSQFFAQVKEIGPPKKKETGAVSLDATIIPYMESVLKEFDLSLKEISKVFNNGRTADGGLSLEKLIKNLEIVGNQAMKESRGIVDLDKSPQMIEKLESLGVQIPEGKQSGLIHIKDFIHTLKQMAQTVFETKKGFGDQTLIHLNVDDLKRLNIPMSQTENPQAMILEDKTARPGKVFEPLGDNKGIPSEVSTAVDRILEKVVISDKTDDSLTAIIKNTKIKFDDPGSKPIDIAGPPETKKSFSLFGNRETDLTSKGEGIKISGIQSSENMKSMMEFSLDSGVNDRIDPKAHLGKPNGKVFDMPQEVVNQRGPETAQVFTQKSQNTGNPLPNYLMDQLGKQISKSLIRGDGVIRFQLKPPELGFVRLAMHMTDNQLNISVAAENGSVKELLLSNIQELRDMLLGQGIRLDKLEVRIGDDFNQTFSNLHEGAQKEQGSNKGRSGKTSLLNHNDTQEELFESRRLSGHDSIVDLVA